MQKAKSIVLGITAGIAAYKAAELARLLIKSNIEVQVVMTESATQFITPTTMQALTGKPVHIGMWDDKMGNGMPHIELSRHADAIVIAPATAEFVAKLLHGRADDLLSTLCLARDCPLLVAPAMNKQMWENPATQRNFAQLAEDNISVLGPGHGDQACGETGDGRMLEPEQLAALIHAHFTSKLFQGKKILITAGSTLEMIDPVRGITNLSSGKMGFAIARIASDMGAEVTLIHGNTTLEPPANLISKHASNAAAMYQAVMQDIGTQDIFISVAAVADYSPSETSAHKIKKAEDTITLTLTRNKDILAEVASMQNPPFCVGFAAETQDLLNLAEKKRRAKKLPLLAANLVSESMGLDHATLTLLDDTGSHPLQSASKAVLATELLKHIHHMIN